MTPQEYCRQLATQSGSSFYYSFLFLPHEQRDAMTALYAFCRSIDDVVDTVQDPTVAQHKLHWWRSEIQRMYSDDNTQPATHPIALALRTPCRQYQLPESLFLEIISGMEMDLHQHSYVDEEALNVYCYRAASTVGILSAKIFALGNDHCKQYAIHMGQALQRINILRDVGEDAIRGRVYLPQNLLKEHGLTTADIISRQPSDALNAALLVFANSAKQHMILALDALPPDAVSAQRAGLIMGRVYVQLMQEIIDSKFAVLHQRISLTPIRKLILAWRTWLAPHKAIKALHLQCTTH